MTNTENVKKPAKTPRVDMPCQPAAVRAHNFKEVALGYSLEQAQLEASRCLQCKNPRCRQGCPVEVRIPEFIAQVVKGDIAEAYRILKSTNSLPAVCGRVCPQENQCEGKCILGVKGEPVAIGRLERFVADNAMHDPCVGVSDNDACAVTNPDLKVACIGSGPSSITVAGYLAARGIKVTVFEALHEAGGVLIYGIPAFRLPKDVVAAELDGLRQNNVEFRTNWVGGRTVSVQQLFDEGYKAVFIGVGAGLPQFLGIPGENLIGVFSANEYLTRVNLMKAYQPGSRTPIMKSRAVAVVGGGNVAMDAARCSKRLGAEVYIIYRRSEAELPARREEVEHAKEEGIIFKTLTNPVEILGYHNPDDRRDPKNGSVCGIKCVEMELGEPDASGRRRPIVKEGSEFEMEMDCVIMSLGTSPNPLIKSTTKGLEINKKGGIIVNEDGLTSRESVYAGGDAVTGAATVILAMGAGKTAAKAIDEQLKNK